MTSEEITPRSEMTEGDWMDVMESEFVDVAVSEMGSNISFIFEHPEIGLHGFQYYKNTGVIAPSAFEVKNE